MALYPTLPDHVPPPIRPTPRSINQARRRNRATPQGAVRAADGKICPIIYGRQYIRPYLGAVLYGRGNAALQNLDSIGMSWFFGVGEIEDYERVFFNDELILGGDPNAQHGVTRYIAGLGAYNYFAWTPYFGVVGQPVDPILAGMAQVTPNYSEGYTDTNVYTENGLLVPQAYIATAQNKLYDQPLQVPTALVKGLKVYDPRGPTTAYSDNPALHLADFLIADYGPRWKADWASVADAADFCDDLLDGKKRNRGGFIINGQAPIHDTIERMRALAGVVVRKEGDNFHFVIDKQGTSVFTFDQTNMVARSFELSHRPLLDKPSQIEVEFTRAKRNNIDILPPWLLDTITYPGPGDPGYSSNVDERRVARIELHDCQDVDVATRFAKQTWFRQLDSKYRLRFVTKDMAAALYPGEIVTVNHLYLPGGGGMQFIIRSISARHTRDSLSYVLELEQYAPTSYVEEPVNEPNPYPDLTEPPGGTSGATQLPLYCLEELAKDDSVLVNIESFPDNYCGIADASQGIAAEGFVLKGEGSDYDNVEGAYIVQVNVNEGLMDQIGPAMAKGRVYLGNAGQPAMLPPSDAVIAQDIGTGEPTDRLLFHYGSPREVTYRAYAPNITEWYPNEMVQDSGWLMRCNRTTSDRPAPQPEGPVAWLVTGEVFATSAVAKRIVAGQKYSLTSTLVGVTGYRFYAPYTDIAYSLTIWDYTDEANPRLLESVIIPSPASTGWIEIPSGSALLVGGGSEIVVAIDYERQTPVSNFSHVWQYEGTSGASNPGDGKMTRASNHSALYVAEEDESGVDQSTSLDTLIVNDTIKITETENASRYLDYRIIGTPTDNGSWRTFPVELVASGSTVRSGKKVNFDGQHLGGPDSADYVYDTNYWGLSEYAGQVKGFLADSYGAIPGQFDDTLYGTDIKGTVYTVSLYWDVLAYSGAGSATGGGTAEDAVLSVNQSFPDATGNVEFEKLSVGIPPSGGYNILHVEGAATFTAPSSDLHSNALTAECITGLSRLGAIGANASTYGDFIITSLTTSGSQRWLFYGDGNSGNTGINTHDPSARFHINGGSDVVQFRVQAWGFENQNLVEVGNYNLSKTHFSVTNIGYAGFNTGAPNAPIHVIGDDGTPFVPTQASNTLTAAVFQHDTAVGDAVSVDLISGADAHSEINFGHTSSEVQGKILYDAQFDRMELRTANTNAIVIDGNQNVGVVKGGRSDNTAALHVHGDGTSDALRVDDGAGDVTPVLVDQNGRLGVGREVPDAKLDVYEETELGATLGDTALMSRLRMATPHGFSQTAHVIRDDDGASWTTARWHDSISIDAAYALPGVNSRTFWERDPGHDLQIWGTGTTQKMVLNQPGHLGIGVTAPDARLDVLRDDSAEYAARIRNTQASAGHVLNVETSGAGEDSVAVEVTTGAYAPLHRITGTFVYSRRAMIGGSISDPTATLHVWNSGGDALRIDESALATPTLLVKDTGTVGIGTENPTGLLEVSRAGAGASVPRITIRNPDKLLGRQANLDFLTSTGVISATNSLASVRGRVVQENPLISAFEVFVNNGNSTWVGFCVRGGGRTGINQGDPDPSTALDVVSSTGGIAPPRMTTAQRDAISNPVPQLIYNTSTNAFNVYVSGEGWKTITTT